MPKLSIYLDDDAYEAIESVREAGEKPSQVIARLLIEAEARKLLKQFAPVVSDEAKKLYQAMKNLDLEELGRLELKS